MDTRTMVICWGLVMLGCDFHPVPLVGDGAAAPDGEGADPPQRPAPPPIVPNLDADIAAPDGAPEPGPAPDAGGGTPAPDAAAPDAPAMDVRSTADMAPPADMPSRPDVQEGCGMVTCDGVAGRHDCCRTWYFFALESEDRKQAQRDGLVTSFVKGADVRASYAFDRAGQDGAVGMLLDRPRRLTAIRVTSQFGGAAAQLPFVTAEGASGSAGCAYALPSGGQADLARPLYCWGSRTVMPDRINVRIEARGPGPANIRVTAVEVR